MPKLTNQTHTPETLARVADRLRTIAAAVDGVVATMKGESVGSLLVMHQSSLTSGLRALELFSRGASDAMQKHLETSGAYGASDASDSPNGAPESSQKQAGSAKARQLKAK